MQLRWTDIEIRKYAMPEEDQAEDDQLPPLTNEYLTQEQTVTLNDDEKPIQDEDETKEEETPLTESTTYIDLEELD